MKRFLASVSVAIWLCLSIANASQPASQIGLRDYGREEEHESNGPEGDMGNPMERLPPMKVALAGAVLLASWAICFIEARNRKAS